MRKLVLILMLSIVLIGCGHTRGADDEMQIKEGYDQIENEQIVFFLSYLDFESRYFAGYFVDGQGDKQYYEITNTDIQDFSDEVIYSFLCEHAAEFPSEEFLTQETMNRCYAYLTRVDEKAEIIKETEPTYDAPGIEFIGIRLGNFIL